MQQRSGPRGTVVGGRGYINDIYIYISHDFLDAQHTLRGRGCTMVKMRRSFNMYFPCCPCIKVCPYLPGVTFLGCLSIGTPFGYLHSGQSPHVHMRRLRMGAPCQNHAKKEAAPLLLHQLQPAHREGQGDYCHGKE